MFRTGHFFWKGRRARNSGLNGYGGGSLVFSCVLVDVKVQEPIEFVFVVLARVDATFADEVCGVVREVRH